MLYQVDVGYACAGVVTQDGKVIDAAPIFHWAVGKDWETFCRWAYTRRCKIIACGGSNDNSKTDSSGDRGA